MPAPRWSSLPNEDSYAAAHRYLALLLSAARVDEALDLLRKAP